LDRRNQRLLHEGMRDAREATLRRARALSLGEEGLEIHAGAEISAGAGDDPDADLVVLLDPNEGGLDPFGDREVDRVANLGTIDRHDRYIILDCEFDFH